MDKQINLQEAVEAVVDGNTLGLGGMTLYRRPVAFVRALIARKLEKQAPRDLTILAFTAGMESDLLVGARMVSRVRTCYFGLEIFGLAPMFTHYATKGGLEVMEESEASLAFGLRAALAQVGFMPGRGWLGTDMLKLRPDVHTIRDPYNGEELVAFPAIHTDVAVIHALYADPHGNIVIGENRGIDEELAMSAGTVIVTAEKIVPELEKADIVSHYVDAVVHAPMGALPTSCHPLYPVDGEAILNYAESVGDPDSFQAFLHTWLNG